MTIKTLPAEYYLDPATYQLERLRIFQSEWWLLCPESAVSEPGAYFSDCITGWPVFVLRGKDGALRGFRNVCRHRGAILLDEERGNTRRILCPYHGWLYDDDGTLLSAPRFGDDAGISLADYGLRRIGAHVWNGLVFIKIDENSGASFEQWIGEIDGMCRQYPGPAALDYHGHFEVSGDINWKLYCENTVEGYHLNSVHERLGEAVASGEVNLRSANGGRAVVFDVTYGSGSASSRLRSDKGLWVYVYPGFQLVLGSNLFKAERAQPQSCKALRSRNWAWFKDLSDGERTDAFEWAQAIVNEDIDICASVYHNMQAGHFEPGPLSPDMESHVAALQDRIRLALDGLD